MKIPETYYTQIVKDKYINLAKHGTNLISEFEFLMNISIINLFPSFSNLSSPLLN